MLQSKLGWIEYDVKAREKTMAVLALFQESEGREELGIGVIRDSFADILFPGTSTIQTRLRYMLFVPWIYQSVERQNVKAPKFELKVVEREKELIEALSSTEDHGVFGRTSGQKLKRLPSSVYWSGMQVWGIRGTTYSQGEYHRRIKEIYQGQELDSEGGWYTWHPTLPDGPEGFPEGVRMALTRPEAEFIRDRILENCKGSFLAYLVANQITPPEQCKYPWELAQGVKENRDLYQLLTHARFFSQVIYGAALLYNLMLAEEKKATNLLNTYLQDFEQWFASLMDVAEKDEISEWLAHLSTQGSKNKHSDNMWIVLEAKGYRINPQTKFFVEKWINYIIAALAVGNPTAAELYGNKEARALIRAREENLKGKVRSRFLNRRALEQWQGGAGLTRLNYRWANVRILLQDLNNGLAAGGGDA